MKLAQPKPKQTIENTPINNSGGLIIDSSSLHQIHKIVQELVDSPSFWSYTVAGAANNQNLNHLVRNCLAELKIRLEKMISPITLKDIFRMGLTMKFSSTREAKALGRAITWVCGQKINLILADKAADKYSAEQRKIAEELKIAYGVFQDDHI